jgi:hypothetical protein
MQLSPCLTSGLPWIGGSEVGFRLGQVLVATTWAGFLCHGATEVRISAGPSRAAWALMASVPR